MRTAKRNRNLFVHDGGSLGLASGMGPSQTETENKLLGLEEAKGNLY